jgi:hypothetical protein
MSTNLSPLEKRVAALEEQLHRKKKTSPRYCSQRDAAEYIGRSREYLRLLHLRGEGPRRMPDGSYAFDDLDAWMRGASHETTGDAA